jgi:diguanylate cyclase (GGDEF)-like protein
LSVKEDRVVVDMVTAMSTVGPRPEASARPRSEQPPGTDAVDERREPVSTAWRSWRPGVRLVIALVVLLPMLAAGVLIVSSANDAWSARQGARVAAADAAQLQVVANARAEMNSLEVPLSAVSYAAGLGVDETELDVLLHPQTPFRQELAQETSQISAFPTFSSTPTLRADVRHLETLIAEVASGSVPYATVNQFETKMAADIDDVFYHDYNRLQAAIADWQPPGSFEVHASALRQTYAAFLAGGQEISGAIFVLEGLGPANSRQEIIQAAGEFQTATAQFVGHLGPLGQQAWAHLQTNPADRQFAGTINLAVDTALNNSRPPFLGNLAYAGSSMAPGLLYLVDLNKLVTASSQDLRNTALAQASGATGRLFGEIAFLGVLALLCLAGVIVGGRTLSRPLARLAGAARRIQHGDFALEELPPSGPQEVVATTAAFNDMASTLKGVEAKAVALAAEDLSHPELLNPLPGRTGRALQASVDTLATRIRERELQRALLHEAATHDGLTGLMNRAAILDYLTNDVSRRREAGETVAVLFVDLDGLKPLNDTYGHEVGDTAILATAMALAVSTCECDVVGRLGGDEFLVVLCHDHSLDGEKFVETIRKSVTQCRIPVGDVLVPLEASVGVALARCDADTDPMVLVRQADEAMYEAKKAARAVRERTPATST